ncbi:uncharacterized protein BO96DRAFT_429622 [Aspergillus niger CBS 101883]|uniref:uncharacterized protein n=1 Tax=Aspergillus lacticoffeatus (strain CBS 101883) TaxID=1450533 RepID=UPI000D801D00|nr:uncharacterized protein BO96DRAFT_429622 [Aspergillus niger CBS 101883]PYH60939.1 hypothetical protein BO96DRAFT_429622 [Aspergillus niger CBS 101883]
MDDVVRRSNDKPRSDRPISRMRSSRQSYQDRMQREPKDITNQPNTLWSRPHCCLKSSFVPLDELVVPAAAVNPIHKPEPGGAGRSEPGLRKAIWKYPAGRTPGRRLLGKSDRCAVGVRIYSSSFLWWIFISQMQKMNGGTTYAGGAGGRANRLHSNREAPRARATPSVPWRHPPVVFRSGLIEAKTHWLDGCIIVLRPRKARQHIPDAIGPENEGRGEKCAIPGSITYIRKPPSLDQVDGGSKEPNGWPRQVTQHNQDANGISKKPVGWDGDVGSLVRQSVIIVPA